MGAGARKRPRIVGYAETARPAAARRAVLLLVAALAPPQAPLAVQPLAIDRGATGLGLALRRVGTSGRVLYVTAHPDDEHNGVLVRLSRGLGLRTALLTVTRGEGGQNAIGPELFGALGVLRTGELMALHRYDAVEQYFGRAYEFGYSFSVEETLEKWGREETLGDIVRVVRAFRPDVILTLPLEGSGRRPAPPGRRPAHARGLPRGGRRGALSGAAARRAARLAGAEDLRGRRRRLPGGSARARSSTWRPASTTRCSG